MKTVTLTPTTPLYLRGDIPGLLAGYCGGVEFLEASNDQWTPETTEFHLSVAEFSDYRLPLSRDEACFAAAKWAAKGEKCLSCVDHPGKDKWQNRGMSASEAAALPALDQMGRDSCPACKGTGYLRAPADLWAFVPGPSKLPTWVARAALWASCVRLNTGMSAIISLRHSYAAERNECWLHTNGTEHITHWTPYSERIALGHGYMLLDGEILRCEVSPHERRAKVADEHFADCSRCGGFWENGTLIHLKDDCEETKPPKAAKAGEMK